MFLCYILTSCNKDEISMQRPLDLAQVTSQIQSSGYLLAKLDEANLTMGAFITEIESNKMADDNTCSLLHKEQNSFKEAISILSNDCEKASSDVTLWTTSHNQIARDLVNVQDAITRFNSIVFDLETLNSTTATRASYDLSDLFSSITDLLNSLQSEIDTLRTELESLQGDVNTLKDQVADLLSSVQSINVVPDYSDGSIGVAKSPYSAMRFEILPLEAAERISALGKNAFSVDAVNVSTRSANENGVINLNVENVSFDGNFVNLLVNCSDVEFNDMGGGNYVSKT